MINKLNVFFKTKDWLVLYPFLFAFFSALAIIIFFLFNISKLPSQIPLMYSLDWGSDQLVNTAEFFLLPAIIVLVALINMVVTWHLHSSQLILKRILSLSTATVAVLIVITALKIIYIFV